MKKVWSLLLVMMMVTSLLIGCSSNKGGKEKETVETTKDSVEQGKDETETDDTQKGEQVEQVELNVAYMPNYASLTTVMAGIEMGYFEEEGIKVNLVEFADGPTIIAAMESGSIDIGYIGPGAHKLAIQGRAKIFATSHLGSADEVIGNKTKGINSIGDLKGKKVAIASGTSSEQILDLTLAKEGLTKADVDVLDMDASAIATAMISGSIDACSTWSPNTFAIKEALGEDAVSLGDAMMFMDIAPAIASWIVNPSYAEQNEELILRYTRALYKAMDYRAKEENFEQISTWVADQVALDFESVYNQRGDATWITSKELVDYINDGSLEIYYKRQQMNFIEAEAVTEEVPVEDYVMFDNMLEAIK